MTTHAVTGATSYTGRFIAARLGVDTPLVPVKVADVPMRAPRPQYCALSNGKLAAAGFIMAGWEDAISRHLSA